MGLKTNSVNAPGGLHRDQADFTQLRHARSQHQGFPVGQHLQPPPMLFSRDGHNLFLGDIYRGRSAFLVCGGPSLTSHDLSLLQQRGILTLAVNNAATVVRPHLWCSVDDPSHFSEAIWYDPGILKFVPLCHMEKRFAIRDTSGELEDSPELVGDMPAVFGYRRNENFVAEQFLCEDTFNWGNHGHVKDEYGHKGSRSVMYVALRLLHYLGVRKVFLLGCDFRMELGKQNYAFEQERSRSSVNGNNQSYEILNVRLAALQPHFEAAGFEVFNCTPDSGLKVFPYVDYAEAIELATTLIPKKIVTVGMYDRKKAKPALQRQPSLAPKEQKPRRPVDNPIIPDEATRRKLTERRDVTVVVPLRQEGFETFEGVRQTWQRHKPWMRDWPTVLLAETDVPSELTSGGQIQVLHSREAGSGSWERSLIRTLVGAETPLCWILSPRAIATSASDWMDLDRLATTRDSVVTGPVWSYAKPATIVDDLDAWGNGTRYLSEFEPLRLPSTSSSNRIQIETISCWSLLVSRDWVRQIDEILGDELPCRDLATLLWYCAKRSGLGVNRIDMKAQGWDHSYGWSPRETARRCAQVLRVPEKALM